MELFNFVLPQLVSNLTCCDFIEALFGGRKLIGICCMGVGTIVRHSKLMNLNQNLFCPLSATINIFSGTYSEQYS